MRVKPSEYILWGDPMSSFHRDKSMEMMVFSAADMIIEYLDNSSIHLGKPDGDDLFTDDYRDEVHTGKR